MGKAEATDHTSPEMMLVAAHRASDRANAAKWDLNIALTLFALLIAIVILATQDVSVEITAPIAVVGLAVVWVAGWRKGRKLQQRFYEEEMAGLRRASEETIGETLETQVQKALRERLG